MPIFGIEYVIAHPETLETNGFYSAKSEAKEALKTLKGVLKKTTLAKVKYKVMPFEAWKMHIYNLGCNQGMKSGELVGYAEGVLKRKN